MRISVERTGGFSGMRLSATLDTDSLPPEEAANLQDLVRSSGLLNAKPGSIPSTGRPDRYSYRITVAEGGVTKAISVGETDVAPELRQLLDVLLAIERRVKKGGAQQA